MSRRQYTIRIVVDGNKAVSGFRAAGGAAKKFDDAVDKSGQGIQRLGRLGSVTFGNILSNAITGTIRQIVAFGKESLRAGARFEQAMARVAALQGVEVGSEAFNLLEAQAKKLGETTAFSASEAAEGMQFLAMAGFDTNAIIAAMPGLLDQAAAGAIDLGTAADITSNILSGFNLEAGESSRVADVLTKTFTTSNTTLQSLGEGMKFVAPIAASLGIPIEEVAAAMGKLGDAGIQGTLAGTALRGIMLRLTDPTREVQKALDAANVSITNSDGSFKSFNDIIAQVAAGTAHMTEQQRAATLSQIAGTRGVSALTRLVSEGADTLREYTKELQNSGGTAQQVAETQLDTYEGSLKRLTSALESLQIEMFETFGDDLRGAVEYATNVIREHKDEIVEMIQFGVRHKKVIAGVAGAMAGYAVTVKAVTVAQRIAAAAQVVWVGVTKAATIAQRALNWVLRANPIGIIITVIAGAVSLIWMFRGHILKLGSTILTFASNAVRAFQGLIEKLRPVAEFIGGPVRSAFNTLSGAVDGTADKFEEWAKDLDKQGTEILTTKAATDELAESTADLGDEAEDTKDDMDDLGDSTDDTKDTMDDLGDSTDDTKDKMKELRNEAMKMKEALNGLRDVAKEWRDDLRDIDTPVPDGLKQLEALRPQLQRMVDQVMSDLSIEVDPEVLVKDMALVWSFSPSEDSGQGQNMFDDVAQQALDSARTTGETIETTFGAYMYRAQQHIDAFRQHFGSAIGVINDLVAARHARRMALIDKEEKGATAAIDRQLASETLSESQREQLLAQREKITAVYDERRKAAELSAAKRQKRMALFEIAVNTATNVIEAFPNVALMALAGALGAIQAAAVKSQPLPFNKGGVVPGPRVNRDIVPATLTPGEFVVRARAAAPNLSALQHLNATGQMPSSDGAPQMDALIAEVQGLREDYRRIRPMVDIAQTRAALTNYENNYSKHLSQ